jgi:hypothetical protein
MRVLLPREGRARLISRLYTESLYEHNTIYIRIMNATMVQIGPHQLYSVYLLHPIKEFQ